MTFLIHIFGLIVYLLTGFALVKLLLMSSDGKEYRKYSGYTGAIFLFWPAIFSICLICWLFIGLGKLCRLVGKAVIGSRAAP